MLTWPALKQQRTHTKFSSAGYKHVNHAVSPGAVRFLFSCSSLFQASDRIGKKVESWVRTTGTCCDFRVTAMVHRTGSAICISTALNELFRPQQCLNNTARGLKEQHSTKLAFAKRDAMGKCQDGNLRLDVDYVSYTFPTTQGALRASRPQGNDP